MAFVQMISSLPPDGLDLNINVSFYPGITIVAQYDNLNQVFTVVKYIYQYASSATKNSSIFIKYS